MSETPRGPAAAKLVAGEGAGAASAMPVPPKNIAPVSAPAPTAPAAAPRIERIEINIEGAPSKDLILTHWTLTHECIG